MNRRSYIKSVLALGTVGFTSFSIFKWFGLNKSLSRILSEKQSLIAEIAETIIPETDTPGAKAAAVDQYIVKIITNCMTPLQQHKFISGLTELHDYALSQYDTAFTKCSVNEKRIVLQHFADYSGYSNKLINKIHNKILGEPFYIKFRSLAIEGYCYSKLGATEGLAYDYIPGKFVACVPIQKNQKSWATK